MKSNAYLCADPFVPCTSFCTFPFMRLLLCAATAPSNHCNYSLSFHWLSLHCRYVCITVGNWNGILFAIFVVEMFADAYLVVFVEHQRLFPVPNISSKKTREVIATFFGVHPLHALRWVHFRWSKSKILFENEFARMIEKWKHNQIHFQWFSGRKMHNDECEMFHRELIKMKLKKKTAKRVGTRA